MTVLSFLDLHVKADALEAAAANIHQTLEATRAREGNLGVDVTVDVDDPTHFVLVEKWASIEADNAYRAWRATPEGASDLGAIVASMPTLTRTELHDEI
ncbi:putative quinol monooxygenase [Subtercola endophyticus]|uniref:putative quinol monooxygenase n=1 Tax=Subtercola endophyticus TaxID=2895559 RepID=UPI001E5495B1|nr:antibiotic biosynthesis monooxygenase [Subtercola endophyticus]UFS59672.1 antibiotic biosynthesis monooxygenase [Subtercola endophyticus]